VIKSFALSGLERKYENPIWRVIRKSVAMKSAEQRDYNSDNPGKVLRIERVKSSAKRALRKANDQKIKTK